jgi:carbon storage regulator
MLVLTRKVGDVIAIGDNIKIVVMAIKGKQVRLGVQADRDTIVHREEVYQKIQKEIREAMTTDVSRSREAVNLLKGLQAPVSSNRQHPNGIRQRPPDDTEN